VADAAHSADEADRWNCRGDVANEGEGGVELVGGHLSALLDGVRSVLNRGGGVKPVQGRQHALGEQPLPPAGLATDGGAEFLVAIKCVFGDDAFAWLHAHKILF